MAADASIVIPNGNDSANIEQLVAGLAAAVTAREIVLVIDSEDGTPDAIAAVASGDPDRVRLLHLRPEQRSAGRGGAAVAGVRHARSPWIVVMDVNLRLPPEAAPDLVDAAIAVGADAAVASRFRESGNAGGLAGGYRRLVSRLPCRMVRVVFPWRLRGVTDPLSGCFALRREAVCLDRVHPNGGNTLLELLVRCRIDRIVEVPYALRPGSAGKPTSPVRAGLGLLAQLVRLRCATLVRPRSHVGRMAGFAAAGGSGILINSAALWLLGGVVAMPYLLAAFLSIQLAIVWNFVLVDRLVMPRTDRPAHHRFGRFWLVNNTLVPVHLAVLHALIQGPRMRLLTANLVAIVGVFLIRYVITRRWVYGPARPALAPALRGAAAKVRRAAHTRVALAFLLTLVAVPAVAASAWNGLWAREPHVPLLIPLAAAGALLVGRLHPAASEPDVHDRQVDALIAVILLVSAAVLNLVRPVNPAVATAFLLAAGVAYFAAATALLLGTRALARLRWSMPFPLLAAETVTPQPLVDAADRVLRSGVAVASRPFGGRLEVASLTVPYRGQTLVIAAETVPAAALAGALLCLLLAGLCCFGARRRLLARLAPAALSVILVAVLSVVAAIVAGAVLGPDALLIGLLPAISDLVLAATVAFLIWRWSRAHTVSSAVAGRRHVPRGRAAVLALASVAVLLGPRAMPELTVLPPRPIDAAVPSPTTGVPAPSVGGP